MLNKNLKSYFKNIFFHFFIFIFSKGNSKYDNKVDVYSFGILMYEILFETTEPYGKEALQQYGIEFRVSQNPNFRPQIPSDDEILKNIDNNELILDDYHKLIMLMKNCWDHEPKKRPDFREIVNNLTQINEEFAKEL